MVEGAHWKVRDYLGTSMLCLHRTRGRETRATAEQEFLSSTSEEVCELWSGRGVVRVADKTEINMKDLFVMEGGFPWVGNVAIFDIVEASFRNAMRSVKKSGLIL